MTLIGLVVFAATVTVVLALGLLLALSAPFDRAFEQQRGAHVTAVYDAGRVTAGQLADAARRPGVAAAGPFDTVEVALAEPVLGIGDGAFDLVGRADPGGPVDRVEVLEGRWVRAPGEVVVNHESGFHGSGLLGSRLALRDGGALTVVGVAVSMSRTAEGWTTPEQLAALHPTGRQMLYRFDAAASAASAVGTEDGLRTALAGVTEGLPTGALTSTLDHLALKAAFTASAEAYLPVMSMFGGLGLLVAVLIVANVVSGAVVSDLRRIGVLKALGFTPNQVLGVYLLMVALPAVAGALLGAALGSALGGPVLKAAFQGVLRGTAEIGVEPWVAPFALAAVPLLVLLAASVPALRAHRLPAARVISAGSAPSAGRGKGRGSGAGPGLRVQRWLAGTRLPRAVSLGIGQPFVRPGRTALTLAAILLGVTTVTLTTGLTATLVGLDRAGRGDGGARVSVWVGRPTLGEPAPTLTARQIEHLLRSTAGAAGVTAEAITEVGLAGSAEQLTVFFRRGDRDPGEAQRLSTGRLPAERPGEVVVSPGYLRQFSAELGDRITLELGDRRTEATIVGVELSGTSRFVKASWETLAALSPATGPVHYEVRLTPGADAPAYLAAVAAADPGLRPSLADDGSPATVTLVTFSAVFTLLLAVVSALGVLNTVLLNGRERRRDLGTLKSLGMTPRQVTVMFVTSMGVLGVLGGVVGVPLGMVAHRVLLEQVTVVVFPDSLKDVWKVPQLVLVGASGVMIAVLGAYLPARSAGRRAVATVLRTE
ncbi:FtsX-like permease family protein [Kitasatospora sp. NPDC096147]|uniref:FtsX-like permease family protein n=1 Tax=Kitasatospora sp. NPDC096147 TaxID=3364093 RepID=UPI0037FE9DBA